MKKVSKRKTFHKGDETSDDGLLWFYDALATVTEIKKNADPRRGSRIAKCDFTITITYAK